MVKYCPRCGAQAEETDKFCLKCGYKLQIEKSAQLSQKPAIRDQKTVQATYPQQPISQQTYVPSKGYIPPKTRKSYNKVIGALAGIIVIIVVLVVLFLFVFNGTNNQFNGTWQVSSMKIDGIETSVGSASITFNSDGTLISDSSGFISTGTWEVKNNKLYITSSDSDPSSFDDLGFDYSFSESNTLILTYTGLIPEEDDLTHTIRIVLVTEILNNDNKNNTQNGDGEALKFIGTWNYEYTGYGNINIIIKNDNSLGVGYSGITYEFGTWSLNNSEICLTTTEDIFETGSEMTAQCFNYYFSNGDTTLTLTAFGLEDIVLTK